MALKMRRPGAGAIAAAQVEAMVRERFALAETVVMVVAELSCQTPGCPPVETAIAFWDEAGQPYRIRIFKPVAEVTEDDLPPRWLLPGLIDEGEGCC
ncbi:MAG TPA: hypothetical protein VNQ78_20355 [Paracoccus sp. (in: a-proteobacteria)]|uniref:hypothetical protein n=1 Tax=Paracoccus sp. TaxID=267 RepID=UPI002CDC5919|nr:hypothetical protein [Paracoccus sp. (in: a-proteobacteria)]HWL59010.1 hypothetical protein [Paracoccus sp. (in: a-proteobacteria)]